MPRSGWLAFGCVLAALAATQPWVGRAWLAQPLTWLLLTGSWLAIIARWHARGRPTAMPGSRVLPAVVAIAGALLIGARLIIAPLPAAGGPTTLPSGDGPWEVS